MPKELIKKIVYPALRSKPDFLIVGAQKAGTTSLYNYLEHHPQILPNKSWKEVHYYDDWENYQKGIGWYLGHFPYKFQKRNKLTFEATPAYLYYQHIPPLIKQDLGNIKIVIILRNPATRAYSAWRMYHSFANSPLPHIIKLYDPRTFAEAIAEELSDKIMPEDYVYHYVGRGKYIEQIDNYFKYFDAKSILILKFEYLHKQLKLMMDKICDFLDIERFSATAIANFQNQKYNQSKYESSASDRDTIEQLKTYFLPFNQQLHERLGDPFNWPE
jgi:hypothetical protein